MSDFTKPSLRTVPSAGISAKLLCRNAMTAAKKYRELTARLLDNEAWGSLAQAQEDDLRDAMDELWWQMTEEERTQQDAWLGQKRLHAPLSLGLEDLPFNAETNQGYRKPAPIAPRPSPGSN